MGYSRFQIRILIIRIFLLALRLVARRPARRAFFSDDRVKVPRIPIFTKELFEKFVASSDLLPRLAAARDSPSRGRMREGETRWQRRVRPRSTGKLDRVHRHRSSHCHRSSMSPGLWSGTLLSALLAEPSHRNPTQGRKHARVDARSCLAFRCDNGVGAPINSFADGAIASCFG